jgi:peptidyl-prolyl cis-trans isomerase SurA
MFKRITLIYIICSLLIFNNNVRSEISIKLKVNNSIITSYDIKKEITYLQILNPNLATLQKKELEKIAKNIIVSEYIKKNEIKKFKTKNIENLETDIYLKNLYTRLNFQQIDDFENKLKENKSYSLNEIKEKIRIDLLWNQLIYLKYNNFVKINEEALKKKLEVKAKEKQIEYMLSEIVFKKNKNETVEEIYNKIKMSIAEIGFENTATIFSLSESSKYGGKVGWIMQKSLSDYIIDQIKLIEKGEFSKPIKIGNTFLILKVNEKKISTNSFDKKKEFEKLLSIETNNQLEKFSRIYLEKIKVNYSIDEI